MFVCHNRCENHIPEPIPGGTGYSWYLNGTKYCSICAVRITCAGRRCPCCSSLMRTVPANNDIRRQRAKEAHRY